MSRDMIFFTFVLACLVAMASFETCTAVSSQQFGGCKEVTPETTVSGVLSMNSSTHGDTHLKFTLKPRLDLTVTSLNDSVYNKVLALPGGEALLRKQPLELRNLDKVVRLNKHGQALPSVFISRNTPSYDRITGMLLDQDPAYTLIIQWYGLISRARISSLNNTVARWQVPSGGDPRPGALLGDELYLVDYFRNYAYSFNFLTHRQTIRKTGIIHPRSLATAILPSTSQHVFIILQGWDYQISIYDEAWNLTATIGDHGSRDGQLDHPWQVLATPWSTILVADNYNHRVSEFNLSGAFLRHVLTSRDGLFFPFNISYSHPFLWVVHEAKKNRKTTVRRYMLCLK